MGKKICNTIGEIIYDIDNNSSNLKFLGYTKNPLDRANTYVNVQCTLCNGLATKRLSDIRNGKIKSCNCLRSSRKTEKAAYAHRYKNYRRSAKVRNLDFYITFDEFYEIVIQNCYYCNAEPIETRCSYGGRISKKTGIRNLSYSLPYRFNSIDRINSSKGYVSGNCRPSCKQCNIMKMDYTESEFLDKIKQIYKNLIHEKEIYT